MDRLQSHSRISSVDALRGASLFFILISNLPYSDSPLTGDSGWFSSMDQWTYAIWSILVSRKFITIFSILFGFGFYILLERAKRQGTSFRKYFSIRMLILFAIGCVHAYLFWYGDIIRTYALCGILLMFICHWPTKRLLYLSIFLSVVAAGVIFIGNSAFGWQQYSYDYQLATEHPITTSLQRYIYLNFRIDPWINFLQDMPITISFCMGYIIMGYLLGRTGFFSDPGVLPFLRGAKLWISLVVGIACSLVFYLVSKGYIELSLPLIWLPFLIIMGMMLQSLAYMAILLRLLKQFETSKLVGAVTSIGRMPLSNYLFQTAWYHILFFHALSPVALFGKLGMTATFALAVLLFGVQAMISSWWLKRFSHGPVESAWRRILPKQKLVPAKSELVS